jgi:cytoskeletal protein CcmA (bactofilin family)
MESASSPDPDDDGHDERPPGASWSEAAPGEGHRPTEINALLGRGTHFEGKLFFEGRVRIDGGFKGEIRGDDVLVIGEGARVSGEIHVAACIVTGGEVDAAIRARDAIELYAPSQVTGSLHAPAIFIDRGVRFEGSCKMAPLEEDALMDPAAALAAGDAPQTPRAGTAVAGAHAGLRSAEPGSATGPAADTET